MANKKRKRPAQRPPVRRGAAPVGADERPDAGNNLSSTGGRRQSGPSTKPPGGGANVARRDRKDQARQARERARKQMARRSAIRRAVVFLAVGAVALGTLWYLNRSAAPKPLPAEARAAADAAGCGPIEAPAATPDRTHLQSGETYAYSDHPATSGPHDPAPLGIPPHTYDQPIPETQAVHNLEHGSVIAYYRDGGDGALSDEAVGALAEVADASRSTIAAPHAELAPGTALAVTAWNKLLECTGPVSGDQARQIVQGFISAYECTSNAPEANNC